MEEYKILRILEVLKFRDSSLDELLILRAIEEAVAVNNKDRSKNDSGIEYALIAKEHEKKGFLRKFFSSDKQVILHLGSIGYKNQYFRRFSPHLPSYGCMEKGRFIHVDVQEKQFTQLQSYKDAIVVRRDIDTILLYHNDNSRK